MPDAIPRKVDYSDRVGSVAQTNFEFLMTELWGPGGRELRDRLIGMDQAGLIQFLAEHKIEHIAGDTILVVDLETARTNKFDIPVPTPAFYTLVLPPMPRRHPNEPHYKQMQAWSAAYYHAVNESYGM